MSSDYSVFNPKKYLKEFYTAEPEDEDQLSMQVVGEILETLSGKSTAVELGGGPVLDTVAAIAGKVQKIVFCDYLQANLDEVQLWLNKDPNAFNWNSYIAFVLQQEGKKATPAQIAQRAAEMRQKTSLLGCDIRQTNPLHPHALGEYDLVVAHGVIEAVATNVPEWTQIFKNISTLVAPGGWLLISVITGTIGYHVGEYFFPCLENLTDSDIQQGYLAAGYDINTLRLKKLPAQGRGYDGVTYAAAKKKVRGWGCGMTSCRVRHKAGARFKLGKVPCGEAKV